MDARWTALWRVLLEAPEAALPDFASHGTVVGNARQASWCVAREARNKAWQLCSDVVGLPILVIKNGNTATALRLPLLRESLEVDQ